MNTYKSTRHAKFLINYHFIWIPKYRKDFLKDHEVKKTVEETIQELSKAYKFDILALEIMPDHIHLFISALPRYSPSELINVIKGATGRKIAQKFPQYKQKDSVWTRAYFVVTAGNVSSETIKKIHRKSVEEGRKRWIRHIFYLSQKSIRFWQENFQNNQEKSTLKL